MVNSVSPQQASLWLSEGKAILIDVRNSDEFKASHIANALSIPLNQLSSSFDQVKMPAEQIIIFQCAKGGRGDQAVRQIAATARYKNPLYNLEGGINGWINANLPVMGSSAKLSIFRQVQMIVGFLISVLVIFGFMGCKTCFIIAGLMGFALLIAGITGWCGMALFLSRMPWNR